MSFTLGVCSTIRATCGSPLRTPLAWFALAASLSSGSTISERQAWHRDLDHAETLVLQGAPLAAVNLGDPFTWRGRWACKGAVGRNPVRMLRESRVPRGMSWRRDVTDWLGGYPYEAATPGEILEFMRRRFNFVLVRQNVSCGLGVSEFVFESPGR